MTQLNGSNEPWTGYNSEALALLQRLTVNRYNAGGLL